MRCWNWARCRYRWKTPTPTRPTSSRCSASPASRRIETAWNRSRVVALLADDVDPAVLLAAAANEIGLNDTPAFTLRDVEDQDWVRLTQSQFDPIHIGKRIWVVPSWHDSARPDALVLELDPGLAFGTGSHPTTRLCMEWLEQSVHQSQSVLDYGCGSGILAILAKKCGANPVIGIDIDPQAVESGAPEQRAQSARMSPTACPTISPKGNSTLWSRTSCRTRSS